MVRRNIRCYDIVLRSQAILKVNIQATLRATYWEKSNSLRRRVAVLATYVSPASTNIEISQSFGFYCENISIAITVNEFTGQKDHCRETGIQMQRRNIWATKWSMTRSTWKVWKSMSWRISERVEELFNSKELEAARGNTQTMEQNIEEKIDET